MPHFTPRSGAALQSRPRRVICKRTMSSIAALDAESDALDKAIQTINAAAASYLCPKCGGDGELRRPDAAGQTETVSCPVCKGTGLKQN